MDTQAWTEHLRIQENYWWHRHKRNFLLKLAQQHPYRRVLEIGAGGGILSTHLNRDTQRVTLDLDARNVQKGGVAARLPAICFKNNAFDLVILSEVLEHLDRPVDALRDVRRVMAAGGRCLITVPAWPMLWSEHDVFYGHRRRYTRELLRNQLVESGFSVLRQGFLFCAPLIPTAMWRISKRILGGTPAGRHANSDFVPLPEWINEACAGYFDRIELPIALRFRLPAGTTCVAVARKAGDA